MLSEDRRELKGLGTALFIYVSLIFIHVFYFKNFKNVFYFYTLKYLKDFVVLGMEFGAISMHVLFP